MIKQSILTSKRRSGQRNWPRSVSMYVSQRAGNDTLQELAEYFRLNHYGSVSTQIRRVKSRMKEDKRVIKK